VALRHRVRDRLIASGSYLPPSVLAKLGNFIRALELRDWLRRHGCLPQHLVTQREDLFKIVSHEIGHAPALYLEFGVHEGVATRYWAQLLTHPDTVLHGFDSFEGLPETWLPDREKGHFTTHGRQPVIADSRVHFFRGWFHETLPTYAPPERDVVVLNFGADLYSSTIYSLRAVAKLVRPGTYLYFDEFSSYGHEERAFREFAEESGHNFICRGATANLLHVLFQVMPVCRQSISDS
jgi:hypothetical protein